MINIEYDVEASIDTAAREVMRSRPADVKSMDEAVRDLIKMVEFAFGILDQVEVKLTDGIENLLDRLEGERTLSDEEVEEYED